MNYYIGDLSTQYALLDRLIVVTPAGTTIEAERQRAKARCMKRVMRHFNYNTKTYKPNGARECARRVRQAAAR